MTSALKICSSDYDQLSNLIDVSRSTATEELDEEMAKADVCSDTSLPENFVALYDKVYFVDIKTQRQRTITLVMPWESNVAEQKISILSPVGIALIGEEIGTTIDWPLLNDQTTRLKITNIDRQPRKPKKRVS